MSLFNTIGYGQPIKMARDGKSRRASEAEGMNENIQSLLNQVSRPSILLLTSFSKLKFIQEITIDLYLKKINC